MAMSTIIIVPCFTWQ